MDLKKRKEKLLKELEKLPEMADQLNKAQAQLNAQREDVKANANRIQGALALLKEMEDGKTDPKVVEAVEADMKKKTKKGK